MRTGGSLGRFWEDLKIFLQLSFLVLEKQNQDFLLCINHQSP